MMSLRNAAFCIALVGVVQWPHAEGAASRANAPDVQVLDLAQDGPARSLRTLLQGQAAVVIFWRSDCAPCLEEIRQLEELKPAAQPMRVLTVGLENPEPLRAQLQRLDVQSHSAWYSLEDPAQVLAAFGTVPRLPLTVAFDASGDICARRRGVLTPVLIAEWVAACMQSAALEKAR